VSRYSSSWASKGDEGAIVCVCVRERERERERERRGGRGGERERERKRKGGSSLERRRKGGRERKITSQRGNVIWVSGVQLCCKVGGAIRFFGFVLQVF